MQACDDEKNVDRSAGVPPGTSMITTVGVSTPFNGVVGGAIGAVIAQQLNLATPWAIASGVIGFLVVFAGQALFASRHISTATASHRPKFPAPNGDGSAGQAAE